jgi:lipopolysaccharide export system protein LptA
VNPDQAFPRELKNPIHLRTSGLVFNQKTGNARTKERVEFRLPQATGTAIGVSYVAQTNVLTLASQINVVTTGFGSPTITAARGSITKNPREVVLAIPHIDTASRHCEADSATLFLRKDNTLDHVLAAGNVRVRVEGERQAEARAEKLELVMVSGHDALRAAVLSGNVTADFAGTQPMHATAGRVVLDFAGKKKLLTKVHAEENVKLVQQGASGASSGPQDLELTAPMVDFFLVNGNRLERAETAGAAQIALRSRGSEIPQTLVTAGKFDAHFDELGQVESLHGAPDARILNRNPGQPDRISTSRVLDVAFQTGSGIDSILQQGNVAYVDGNRRAWGDRARYTPADQILVLTGSPRVVDGSMTTSAHTMRLNRATGDAFADGNVKSTYSDLKPQPNGALLASSSPIHVTARSVTVHGNPALALYEGGVRLWQDANIVEAPSIEFDRDHRSMVARGTPAQPVSTVFVETGRTSDAVPVAFTSSRLTYTDSERRAHFDENVTAKGADVTITARAMDAYLEPRGPATSNQPAGKVEKIVAQDRVVITQPSRRATGDQLVYTLDDDKFVLSGGSPSIFDAEHGKITGVSLTFFRRDDRVLVEGSKSSPTVTQTQVAR